MNTPTAFRTYPQGEAEGISEIFRMNLLRILEERKIPAAAISRRAGLNSRAVKDIEERRAKSPRIVTVFKLAEALEVTPQFLLGLENCHCSDAGDLSAAVRFFLSMSPDQRELLVAAIDQQVNDI